MVKINIKMPETCNDCYMCSFAWDSDLFEDGERYCCIKGQSIENIAEIKRADFCPLIEMNE